MSALVSVLFLPTMLVLVSWKKPRTPGDGCCANCDYSLANLPADSLCPECGSSPSEHAARYLEWSQNHSARRRRLVRIVVAIVIAVVCIESLRHAAVAAAYWWDGFGFMRGWDLAPMRELKQSRADSIVALVCTLPFIPLLAFKRRRSLRWAILAMVPIAFAVWIKAAYFAY